MNDPRAEILRVGSPPDQLLRFQPIDGCGDGAAREQHFSPDDVHRLRALVKEHFQYRELRKPEAQRGHASNGILLDRVGGFAQHPPDVSCCFAARFRNACREPHSPPPWRRQLLHTTRRRVILAIQCPQLTVVSSIPSHPPILMSIYYLILRQREKTNSMKTTYKLDPAHSTAQFVVRHMMITNVRGGFSGVQGKAVYDPENPAASSVDVVIDANTINTQEADRDKHLKSPDFLDVEKYPTITP